MPLIPWGASERRTHITRDKNTVHINTPTAEYSVIYGVHILSTDPQLIPPNSDALVLETGAVQWSKDPEAAMEYLQQHVQYKKLFHRLEQDNTSILFADLNYKRFPLLVPLLDMALMETEINIGTRLLKKSYKSMKKNNKSTLDLFKIAAGTAGGLWLISSMLSEVGRVGSMLTGIGQEQTAEFQKLSSKLHPELFVLIKKLRDTIIAYKMQEFAQSSKHHSVSAVMGGAHTGLETQLTSDHATKISTLKRLRPIIQKLVVPESFYQMAQFDFKKGNWQLTKMHTIPQLENLILTNS